MIVPCVVRTRVGGNAWEVTFPSLPGYSLWLDSDWDQHSFAQACGRVPADTDPLCPEFVDLDPETITACPDDYLDAATADVVLCPKCDNGPMMPPAYPGDYYDCAACGHSQPMETP